MDELTLSAHILAGAAVHDGCPVIFTSGQGEHATTLGTLVSDAEKVAGALQARGIGPGDVVAFQLPGSYEGAVVQAAVGLCGAVLLPVVMIYGPREMSFVLSRSGATAVFVPREHRGRPHAAVVLAGLSGLRALKLAVVVGDATPGHGEPGDRAALMYTSGTTADPKGVQHSHRTLLAEATSRVYTHSGPGARHLGLFPPGHIAGLLSLLRILLLGTPTVIMQSWEAALAASLIDRYAVTSSGGAPVQLAGLLDQQAQGTAALATLREFLPGRWFRTGDVGRLDADGYLTVTDRLKDIIIRGGENISAREVEDLLVTHPAIADVAVIPAPDPAMGERVCAVVVLRPGFSFGIEEARARLAAAGAARQKTPEVIVVVDELPRTPAGKVRKEVLRARAASPG